MVCNRVHIPEHCRQCHRMNHSDQSWCGSAHVEWYHFPAAVKISPQQWKRLQRRWACVGKETWPWPSGWCGPQSYNKGFSSSELLRERSSCRNGCDEEQAREGNSFPKDASAVTQKPLKTLIPKSFKRSVIRVNLSNKPVCHNVKLAEFGKMQTLLFIFPFSYLSCLTINFVAFTTFLFTYCNSITVTGLLQYSWGLPALVLSTYEMPCCQGNPAPFVVPDLQCSPSFLLASQLPPLSYIWHLLIFNRKAGRNIHALIHANVSPSPIILGYFLLFSQYCTIQVDTLLTLQCWKIYRGQVRSE